MAKAYQPGEYEKRLYQLWEEADSFKPNLAATKSPFTIILPPPNANGNLHTGHAMYVVEDIMVRYRRMQGHPALWLPGTDHAGIETQVVFERELAKEGKSRFDFTPGEFYDAALAYTKQNQHNIISQLKSLGFSLDWSRLKFTLDDDIIETVYETFKRLEADGHIYRGDRIVNWCPHCRSSFADIEIKHRDQIDPLYYVKYGPFVIATVRPEPMFADTAIAVHPRDERYQQWIGKEVEVELLWGKRKLPVIADEHVDPEFGTGVVKVTPAHDPNDWDMAQRHGLEVIQGIGTDGLMAEGAGRYAGMTVLEARDAVAKDLEERGLIDHIDMNREHSVAYHDRCGNLIEPLITEQWWIRVEELKKPAIEAVKSGQINIVPARFKKSYIDWLENLRDWNISRQSWFGIHIPVFYNANASNGKKPYIISANESDAIEYYGEGNYEAETDTFDTWFSSSQWPFATLMATGDFDTFYPTTVMETGRDILFQWVTRMVMLGIYRTGRIPFENVYLHGLVNDAHGKKMSKSKGNVLNPLELTEEYGTDALRLALTIGITPGNDGALSNEKVKGYRNFCNKLWNVARFTLSKIPADYSPDSPELSTNADHYMARELTQANAFVTKQIEAYRFSEAGQALYSLLWDKIADRYIEYSKNELNPAMLATALETTLRLLHPIAPFVTEAIWQELPWTSSLLISEQWPNLSLDYDKAKADKFEREIIELIAQKAAGENAQRRKALERELALKQNAVQISENKLANAAFVDNAPTEVVEAERKRLDDAKIAVKELQTSIKALEDSSQA